MDCSVHATTSLQVAPSDYVLQRLQYTLPAHARTRHARKHTSHGTPNPRASGCSIVGRFHRPKTPRRSINGMQALSSLHFNIQLQQRTSERGRWHPYPKASSMRVHTDQRRSGVRPAGSAGIDYHPSSAPGLLYIKAWKAVEFLKVSFSGMQFAIFSALSRMWSGLSGLRCPGCGACRDSAPHLDRRLEPMRNSCSLTTMMVKPWRTNALYFFFLPLTPPLISSLLGAPVNIGVPGCVSIV